MKTNHFFLPMKVPTKTFQEKKLRTVKGRAVLYTPPELVEIRQKYISALMPYAPSVPAMVIHDKFGSLMKKEGRVEKFVDLCMEEYKCYEEGYVRLDEMAKILKEEAGVEIEGWH